MPNRRRCNHLISRAVLAGALVVGAAAVAPAARAAELSDADRAFLVSNLEKTRDEFLKSIAGLSAAQWNFKAGQDRWSIAQCAEHIISAEGYILGMVTDRVLKTPASADAPFGRDQDNAVLAALADRTKKATAPEPIKPSETGVASPEAAAQKFGEARAKTISYAENTKDDLRGHVAPGPGGKNLDAYEYVLLLSAHSGRHTAQIEEVKAAPDYPKQ